MSFSPTLICSLLLASATLAGPLERRDPLKSYTRAGVMVGRESGTFQANSGTITIQDIQGSAGASISAWVGIDSDKCNNFLRAGINFTTSPPAYAAWYEWFPSPPVYVINFTISAGDNVTLQVGVHDNTMSSGYVMVKHPNDKQGARNYFLQPASGYALCGESAEWILGNDRLDLKDASSHARIGTLYFTDAVASSLGGQAYGPLAGDEIEMVDTDGSNLMVVATVASRDKDSLTLINPGEW